MADELTEYELDALSLANDAEADAFVEEFRAANTLTKEQAEEKAKLGLTGGEYDVILQDRYDALVKVEGQAPTIPDSPMARKARATLEIHNEHAQRIAKAISTGAGIDGFGASEKKLKEELARDLTKRRKKPGKRRAPTAEEQALTALLAAQTHQNFIMQNMRAFATTDATVALQENNTLDNLVLVSKYTGNLVNKLTTSARLLPLMDASPYHLSQLVPYFRLAKKNKEGKLTEFQFMDRFKDHYYDQKKNRQVLNSSLGQGVGLKSFKWHTTGTNMFSAPRTLRATLSLHFQSVSELVRTARMDEGGGGPLWQDLIYPQRGVTHPSTTGCPTDYDSINQKIRTLAAETAAKAEGASADDATRRKPPDFSLVVEAGWKYSPKSDIPKNLKDAVDMSRTVLNLTLVSHKFNFREEGTIDLDIEYVARLESIIESYGANLLTATSDEKPNPLLQELEATRREAASMNVALDSPTGDFNCLDRVANEKQKERIDKQASKVDKKIRKLEEKVDALVKRAKVSMYGKFTQHMVEQQLLQAVDLREEDYANGNLDPQNTSDPSYLATDSKKAALPAISEGTTLAVNQVSTRKGKEREVSAKKLLSKALGYVQWDIPPPKGIERLAYFYLGDLINYFAGMLPHQDANNIDRFEIVLGDLIFLDYKQVGTVEEQILGAYGKENYDDFGPDEEEQRKKAADLAKEEVFSNTSAYMITQNLAYVPVSFSAYTKWFTDEIINGDTAFTFKSFLQSLTTKLVVGALQSTGSSLVSGDLRRLLKERNRVRATTVYGKNKSLQRGKMVREYHTSISATGDFNSESNLLIKPSLAEEENNAPPVKGNVNKNRQFFVLSATRLPRNSQVVDEQRNAEDGIYHLKIGADRGLLKRLSLEREANARIRDANIMRAYNQGTPSLGIIQEPYQASVQVFGCGFFQPGQYVYINPTNIGLGTQHERYSIAHRIGMGGFYLITEVSTTLERGILQSTLKCVFQNYGYLPGSKEANAASDPVQEVPAQPGSMEDLWAEVMQEEIDKQNAQRSQRMAKLEEDSAAARAQCDKFK
jgi:hypothetical protein